MVAERQLHEARLFWLATVRPEGRPHVPLIAVWVDGALYFASGDPERSRDGAE
jgi:pyridoxamine 5'-phosphate oxidase-like protein